ncbi:hypothetical protein D3C73_1226260 [compost metagenome]
MLIAHIFGLHQFHCIGTVQRKNTLGGEIQACLRCFITGYRLEEFRFQIQIPTIVSTLQRRHRHRPDPVAQRDGVMQTDLQQRPFGIFNFGGVDWGVVFCFVVGIL